MAIYKGFVEGALMYDPGTGTHKIIPYNNIQEASFEYNGELYIVETFNLQGDKVPSAACSSRAEAKFMLKTQTPDWAMIQSATATLDAPATLPILASETVVVAAGDYTVNLSRPISTLITKAAIARSSTGEQLSFTAPSASDESIILDATPSSTEATQVRVSYWRDPDTTTPERIIEIGKGEKLKEGGVYGRFVGCGDTLLVYARRAVTQPGINFAVGSNPAEAGVELTCLTDEYGVLASIVKLNPGESV